MLRLITRLNIGGPARQALLLTRALAPEFDTTLAAGRPAETEGELAEKGVSVHHVPLVRPVSPIDDIRAVVEVRRLIRLTGAAIVHTHMAKAGAVGRAAAATLRPRPRTVHTFHGHVLDGYFSACAQKAFVLAERALARRTDALVAVSEEVRDELLSLGIGRPNQFHVMRLGLDLAPFFAAVGAQGHGLRADLGLGTDTPLVAIVGRLVAIKDHQTVLRAMVLLPGVHLAVVGDGELGPSLRSAVEHLGLAGRVHFTGWRMDMAEVLTGVDVVLLTSRNEGTPVALIEAAAAGRAVVATAVGGVSTVVRDGVTGYLVGVADPAAVADRVARLLSDRATRDAMGRAGHKYVVQRFGSDRLVSEIRSLYEELLSG